MKDYVEKNARLQPKRMLMSSFHLKNGALITPSLLFHLKLGLVCQKTYRFVQFFPEKCLNTFVQSAMHAQRQGDENPISSVVAQNMKRLANSPFGIR